MANRILVDGPTFALEAVRRALPDTTVGVLEQGRPIHDSALLGVDCVFICQTQRSLPESVKLLWGRAPVVVLLVDVDASLAVPTEHSHVAWAEPPYAHCSSAHEIKLAARAAIAEFHAQRFFKELAGPWMHDARGALGVAQLALKVMATGADAPPPLQKVDNAVTRLGWLIERLPTQYALSLDLPELHAPAAMVFPTLLNYVQHLRRVQPRRTIDLHEGPAAAMRPTDQLVPYASGFAELAFNLSPARAPLVISAHGPQALTVESECPDRRSPFDGCTTMTASDLEKHGAAVPYRLLEIARLARRTGAELQLEFTARGFTARAVLSPVAHGHSQLT